MGWKALSEWTTPVAHFPLSLPFFRVPPASVPACLLWSACRSQASKLGNRGISFSIFREPLNLLYCAGLRCGAGVPQCPRRREEKSNPWLL